MALPEIKRAEAERDLEKFGAEHGYPGEIRYTLRVRGNDITLFEERPPWDGRGAEWTRQPIARFRCLSGSNAWAVDWRRANGRWLRCDWIGQHARFRDALAGVETDAKYTFFG